jgi:hypothetical protein
MFPKKSKVVPKLVREKLRVHEAYGLNDKQRNSNK